MKWFFCFNHQAVEKYGDLIRVAVWSAKTRTPLEAHAVYDGPPTDFTRALQRQGVTIWPHQSRFQSDFVRLAPPTGSEGFLATMGTYLRLDLPLLAEEWGWGDELVLFTDIDVFFLRDPMPFLQGLSPRLFAVAPEMWRENWLHFNAGVMLQNLPAMRVYDTAFEKFLRAHWHQSFATSWDQGALRAFFNPMHRALWRLHVPDRISYRAFLPFSRPLWEKLPAELNWKPHWGPSDEAAILHFHGPKPFHREHLKNHPIHHSQRGLFNEHFEFWCDRWEEDLAQLDF